MTTPSFGAWCRSSCSSGGDIRVDIALGLDGIQIRVRDSQAPADPPCSLAAPAREALLAAVAASRPAGPRAQRRADTPSYALGQATRIARASGELVGERWSGAARELGTRH
jgi:uncharacterized protein DUF397